MVVDFVKRIEMAAVNTYFKEREGRRVTYMSGSRSTQTDYILCKRCDLKEFKDCNIVRGECAKTI